MKAETACKRSSPPNHQDCSRSDPTMQIRVSLFSNLRQQMAILPLTLCAAAGALIFPRFGGHTGLSGHDLLGLLGG